MNIANLVNVGMIYFGEKAYLLQDMHIISTQVLHHKTYTPYGQGSMSYNQYNLDCHIDKTTNQIDSSLYIPE